MIRSFLVGLTDLVYPPICVICRRRQIDSKPFKGLCQPCQTRIEPNKPPFCLKCTRHLPGKFPRALCRDCLCHDFHFDFAYSACLYKPFIRTLIHNFKYHQKTYLRHLFVKLMIDFINLYHLDIEQFDGFVPVPLSATRHRERGYNQALLLAQLLAKNYDKPYWPRLLYRIRHTRNQTVLSQKERFTNVERAFRIKPSSKLINKNILVIDDLITTGATASACALALKQGGANRVAVLSLAIA